MANIAYTKIDNPFPIINGTQYRAIEWNMNLAQFLDYNNGKDIYVYDVVQSVKEKGALLSYDYKVLGFAIDKQ